MNVVHMSEKGQITVPKEARKKRGLSNGSVLEFIDDASGDLIFRPVSPSPQLDLIEHLLKLRGLEIPKRKHHGRPRV